MKKKKFEMVMKSVLFHHLVGRCPGYGEVALVVDAVLEVSVR